MSSINLTWEAYGKGVSYSIYRSENSISLDSLPEPIATEVVEKSFSDSTVIYGKTYHYRVSSVKNSVEKISAQKSIDTAFNKVELLLDGQSASYPSSVFQDRSSEARVVTVLDGALKKNTLKFYYDGVMSFDGISDGLQVTIPALGVGDFTLEIRGILYHQNSEAWSRLFQIGSEATGYLSLFRINTSSPAQYALHTRISGDISASLVDMSIFVNQSEFVDLCVMRKSGVFYTFINGVIAGSNSAHLTHTITATTLYLMRNNTTSNDTKADIDTIRLSSFARYDPAGYIPLNSRFPVT